MKILATLLFSLCLFFNAKAQCTNGDAESADFSGWSRYEGVNFEGTINLSNFSVSTGNQQSIVTAGADPIVGAALPMVIDGSNAFRVGDITGTESASIMSYTFTVGSDFSFLYALVFGDGGHGPNDQPFFSYWVSTSNNLSASLNPGNLIYNHPRFVADATNNFFTVPYPGVVYKQWQTECVPGLSGFVGQQVTIYFLVADCSPVGQHPGAHAGYVYIDGLCKPNLPSPSITGPTTVCNIDEQILFDGSGTSNETDFYWKIEQTNSSGVPYFNGITYTSPVSYNTPVTTFNVSTVLANAGVTIPTKNYFKITLFVKNCNGNWVSTSQMLYTNYPDLITDGNKVICCGSATLLKATIYSTFPVGYPITNYRWYDEAGNFLGNGSVVNDPFTGTTHSGLTVTPNKSTKYRVEFESYGCKNRKWVYVTTFGNNTEGQQKPKFIFPLAKCSWPKYIEIQPNSSNYYFVNCIGSNSGVNDLAFHLGAAQNSISYLWNTGEETPGIMMQANTAYSVIVTSPCGTKVYNITPRHFTGAFPTLSGPTGLTMTQPWKIYQVPMAAGAIPAYNARKYRLRIYNRWGNIVHEVTGETETGFYNGEILWDGKISGVYPTQTTVFDYSVELWNCDNINASSNVVKNGSITFVR